MFTLRCCTKCSANFHWSAKWIWTWWTTFKAFSHFWSSRWAVSSLDCFSPFSLAFPQSANDFKGYWELIVHFQIHLPHAHHCTRFHLCNSLYLLSLGGTVWILIHPGVNESSFIIYIFTASESLFAASPWSNMWRATWPMMHIAPSNIL